MAFLFTGFTTYIKQSEPFSDICRDGFELAVTYSMCVNGVTEKEFADGFLKQIKEIQEKYEIQDFYFIAHNKNFEIRVLKHCFLRLQKTYKNENYIFPLSIVFFDLMVLIKNTGFKTKNLDFLLGVCQIEKSGEEHTATRDVLNESLVLIYFLKNYYKNDDDVNTRFKNFIEGNLNYEESIFFCTKLKQEYLELIGHLSSQVIDKQFTLRDLPKKVDKVDKKLKKVIINVGGKENFDRMIKNNPTLFTKNGCYNKLDAKKVFLKAVLSEERGLSFQVTQQSEHLLSQVDQISEENTQSQLTLTLTPTQITQTQPFTFRQDLASEEDNQVTQIFLTEEDNNNEIQENDSTFVVNPDFSDSDLDEETFPNKHDRINGQNDDNDDLDLDHSLNLRIDSALLQNASQLSPNNFKKRNIDDNDLK